MNDPRPLRTIEWRGDLDGCVVLIDQTRLPEELVHLSLTEMENVRAAIVRLSVRGAPAIGIAAAMGLVLGVRGFDGAIDGFQAHVREVAARLASARPTAVNLSWALKRMTRVLESRPDLPLPDLKRAMLEEAKRIRDEDAAMCRAIGEHGQALIQPGCGVLTYCNAGGLATAEYGTALAPMYRARELGRSFRVFVPETRPLLQGSRLTAWELMRAGIDVTVLCDGMIGSLVQSGIVDLVITGADRIAANGDTANKVGTYSAALIAAHHRVPFYVAAPGSTIDLETPSGQGIPIEERSADEIRKGFGRLTAPPDAPCYCPAFDVTPVALIRGLITERGLISPVTADAIAAAVG
ncbi:MAG: S-methyl-5-thioribose-1-phosphate isomerase [Phycisphaerales bacterium]|nr:MAG: S-methyl-5-thioribose-1-phosphate isomerase [Phycisphaerales bacterium]